MDELIDELYQSSIRNERILGRHLDALQSCLHQAEDRNYTWSIDRDALIVKVFVTRRLAALSPVVTEYSVYGESNKPTIWRIT